MKNSKHIIEECAERISIKRELLSIVKHYSKIIDKIESASAADEESPHDREHKQFKTT